MINDPKQIVTPYAFSVHPDVLGLPLATPKRRLAALLLDLLIASILTALGNLVLATAVTAIFFWIAVRTKGTNSFRNFIRFGFASFASIFVFALAIGVLEGTDGSADSIVINVNDQQTEVNWSEFGQQMATLDYSDPDVLDEELADIFESLSASPVDSIPSLLKSIDESFSDKLSALSYAIQNNDTLAADSIGKLVGSIAAASEIASLEKVNSELRTKNAGLIEENEELEETLENPGVYQTLKKMFGMLGLSLGWVGIYFVASIAFFRGQTLGKRLLKIRVIRLNNKPISIFFSFERFGGYAAGIATGLLGFFQIFWDVNRQGIHDKIAGTVVIDLREKRAASTAHLREEILDQENLLS